MKFQKIVRTRPPFDKRSDNPSKNYGVGALQIWFILKGKSGATQIMIGTKLYLAKQMKEWKDKGENYPYYNDEECMTCWDVGFYSKKRPEYMDKNQKQDGDILGTCYYDGSGLRGETDKVIENYINYGESWIWEYLEKYYYDMFPKDRPDDVNQKNDGVKQ